jgi:predicted GNAT family acetyltransferase
MCELIAVVVDPAFGGKGIGGKLTDLCVKKAFEKGFKVAFAECSSHYSTRALEKFGGKVEHEIVYADYTYGKGCCSKGTQPLADIPAPHTSCKLVVFRK